MTTDGISPHASIEDAPTPRPIVVVAGVACAVLAVSAAAILIRKANAPPLGVAFWRNALAVAVLLPTWALRTAIARRRQLPVDRLPRGRTLAIAIASGVCLAAHFGLWIPSLQYTSVAISVVLVCTQPLFVALLAAVILRERTSPLGILAIVAAVIGVGCIALGDPASPSVPDPRPHLGAGLALGGAVAVAVYVLIGRSLRSAGMGLLAYAVVVYGSAALVLASVAATLGVPLGGYSASTWGWLVAIALGPQILGHTLFNWALGHVRAPVLSSTILLEPIVSALLAWLILDESMVVTTWIGGAIVLTSLGALLWSRR